jgi:hypothetical protein
MTTPEIVTDNPTIELDLQPLFPVIENVAGFPLVKSTADIRSILCLEGAATEPITLVNQDTRLNITAETIDLSSHPDSGLSLIVIPHPSAEESANKFAVILAGGNVENVPKWHIFAAGLIELLNTGEISYQPSPLSNEQYLVKPHIEATISFRSNQSLTNPSIETQFVELHL